jgi:anti-sigma factor RsiW
MTGTCRTTLELLGAYTDGALDPRERAALVAHLADCPRCTEFLASYQATARIIGGATDFAVPDDVAQRLLVFLAARSFPGGS